MTPDDIATRKIVAEAEERLTQLLLKKFNEVLNEVRSQNMSHSDEEYLTVKELMAYRKIKSRTTIEKYIKKGILIYEDWGDGEKRSLRFPVSQFKNWIHIDSEAKPLNRAG